MNISRSLQLILVIGLLIMANLFASAFFRRVDLTKEKRYSLSPVSIQTVDSLTGPAFIQVYTEGDFPPNIRRFQEAIRTTLSELQQYSGGNLDFEFVNPRQNAGLIKTLKEKQLTGIPVRVQKSEDDNENTILYPYALIRYNNKEQYIDLLKGCTFPNGQIDFVRAESDLEYKLVAPLRNLMREEKGVVAILQGHEEVGIDKLGEWVAAMQNGYDVFTYDMRKNAGQALAPTLTEAKMKAAGKTLPDNLKYKRGIDVIVIPQPQTPFTEREKYELDQYLMRGGSVFWIMSQEIVDMDMFEKRATLSQLRELNLDDLFLKYGIKINYNLIQDLNCEKTEVFQEGPSGGTFTTAPWVFYPMVLSLPQHPVSRNIDQILLRYASSMDTFPQKEVRKSIFLASSPASRVVEGKQFIDMNQYLKEKPPAALFKNKGNRIIGILAEGNFVSLFAGRKIPVDSLSPLPPTAPFGEKSGLPGKIAVISDGHFFEGKNFRGKTGYIPYDNKALLMNAIDYLAGDPSLTQIRAKEVEVRMLKKESNNFQLLLVVCNLLLPILLIVIFGVVRDVLRKRKQRAKTLSK